MTDPTSVGRRSLIAHLRATLGCSVSDAEDLIDAFAANFNEEVQHVVEWEQLESSDEHLVCHLQDVGDVVVTRRRTGRVRYPSHTGRFHEESDQAAVPGSVPTVKLKTSRSFRDLLFYKDDAQDE